jgi:hypothetical protein
LLRQQFTRGPATPNSPDARRDFRGRLPEAVPRGEQGDRGQPRPVRPGTNAVQGPVTSAGPRPAYAPGSRAPGSRPAQKYPAEQTGGARPYQEHRPQALEGIGRGQDARNASARGQASLPSRPPVQQRQPTPQPQRVAPAPAQQATPQQQPQPAPSPHNPPRQRGEPQK